MAYTNTETVLDLRVRRADRIGDHCSKSRRDNLDLANRADHTFQESTLLNVDPHPDSVIHGLHRNLESQVPIEDSFPPL